MDCEQRSDDELVICFVEEREREERRGEEKGNSADRTLFDTDTDTDND